MHTAEATANAPGTSKQPDERRLLKSLRTLAEIIERRGASGAVFLPIFDRLEAAYKEASGSNQRLKDVRQYLE